MKYKEALSLGEHYATIRGVKLQYHVKGQGPLLLFQPGGAGWGGDITPYIETLGPLEKVRTVIYLEPRGIGRSQRLSDPTAYSMEEYVEETEAVRQYFEIPKIAIAGHCYGGCIALKYAIRYPQKVERLLLLDTSPHWLLGDLDSWLKQKKGYDEAIAKMKLLEEKNLTADEKLKAYYRILIPMRDFYDYEKISTKIDQILSNMVVASKTTQYFQEHEFDTYDVRGLLGNITAPTLIVAGDDDLPPIKIGSRLLREEMPNSNLVVIEKCGHWPFIDAPEAFFKAVIPFLTK